MSNTSDASALVDPARFRQVMGHFPTGVTVVTAHHDGAPAGLAVGSFASVSLEPPMVLFCVGKSSRSFERIRASGRFCVNLLGEDQEDLCRVFAGQATDKFEGVGWHRSPGGSPLLEGVMGYLDAEIDQTVEAGDHWIVVGAVTSAEVFHEGGPLVFFRSGYGRFTS